MVWAQYGEKALCSSPYWGITGKDELHTPQRPIFSSDMPGEDHDFCDPTAQQSSFPQVQKKPWSMKAPADYTMCMSCGGTTPCENDTCDEIGYRVSKEELLPENQALF